MAAYRLGKSVCMSGDVIQVVAAVIRRGGKVLLASRPVDKPPAGWEFPGGKIEPGESAGDALVRELAEELGVRVFPGVELGFQQKGRIALHFISAELPEQEIPTPREGQACFWVDLTSEPPAELLPADHLFWRELAEM